MTTNHSTRTDAQRLQALHAQQLRGSLTPEEVDEANALERLDAARKIIEGIYAIAGGDYDTEQAFGDLWLGLGLAGSARAGNQELGLIIALNTLQRNPDALTRAIRVLRDKLLAEAPELTQALRVLAQDLEVTAE